MTLPRLDIVDDRESGAWISDDELYRYRLWRRWGEGQTMVWVMLNPSTADATEDDATIRRCIGFAKREGCGGIEVVNRYALRATNPKHLLDHPDPEGPLNPVGWAHSAIYDFDSPEALVVFAWGAFAHADLPTSKALTGYAGPLPFCLGTTQDGAPCHPLRLSATTELRRWQ